MSSDISKFIKNTPLNSLQKYFDVLHGEPVDEVDWTLDEKSIRKSLLNFVDSLKGENLALLKSDAERINALTDELGQSILKQCIKDEEIEEYSKLENEFDRTLWMFLKDTERFLQVEDFWYADTKRQGQIWEAFAGPEQIAISRDQIHLESFKNKLMDLYRIDGKVQVDIYERYRSDSDDNDIEIVQIMVYREDLPSIQLTFEKEKVVPKIVRPVKQVALTYEPKSGYIEIIAEGKEQRKSITKTFSETLLQSPIEGEKIPLKQYDIQKLLKPVVLSFDPEDGIDYVKVTMLKVAQPNSYNNVTLDVAAKEDRSIYDLSKEYFGNNDPLQSGFRLKQVRISIKFMPDDESRRGKMLHVKIREPNGCDLKSKLHKEKLIGEKYLEKWGLVETI